MQRIERIGDSEGAIVLVVSAAADFADDRSVGCTCRRRSFHRTAAIRACSAVRAVVQAVIAGRRRRRRRRDARGLRPAALPSRAKTIAVRVGRKAVVV